MPPITRASPTLRFGLLLSCLALMIAREPDLLANPRLWAEEGRVFYSFARHHSLWEILTTPLVGYLTLFNGIVSALQARIFSPEAAATVSTLAGLLIQLVPVYLIVSTSHDLWSTPIRKITCLLIVILVTPHELWINTTNAHFHFGLVTLLIMLAPARDLPVPTKWFMRGLLVMGNLTGPASMLITPAFLLKAYVERSREKTIQAAIQFGCAGLQAAVVLYSLLYDNTYHRLERYDASTAARNFIIDHFSLNVAAFGPEGALAIGAFMAAYFVTLLVRHRRSTNHLVLLLAFCVVAVFSTLGSLNMLGSPRYGYLPTCILLLLVAGEAFSHGPGRRHVASALAGLMLVASLAINAFEFRARMGEIHAPIYPRWKDEVAKWRLDPAYKPIIRPEGWNVAM